MPNKIKNIGKFLKKNYGITMRDLMSKKREILLAKTEEVSCNLCGSEEKEIIAKRDKYNLPVNTVICKKCGLLYLSPRPNAESYRFFYESGGTEDSAYHIKINSESLKKLLINYFGENFDYSKLQDNFVIRESAKDSKETAIYKNYGINIYNYLSKFIPKGSRIFEVGASRGVLLKIWRDLHECEVTGVEPKIQSVREAKDLHDIKLFQGFSDNPDIPENYYDLVLNIRTLNHMLNPFEELRRSWRWLKENGIIFIDVQDTISRIAYKGLSNKVEIDHPYMFSINTLTALLNKAGFDVIKAESVDVSRIYNPERKDEGGIWQLRVIGRKSLNPVKFSFPDPIKEMSLIVLYSQKYEDMIISKYEHFINKLKNRFDKINKKFKQNKKINLSTTKNKNNYKRIKKFIRNKYAALIKRFKKVKD